MPFKVYTSRFVLIIALLVAPLYPKAQNKVVALPTNSNNQIEYLVSISVPNTSQAILFKRALKWMVGSKAYKFKKIDLMDNEFGRLIASGTFIFNVDEVFISLKVDVKNNNAQLKVSRFDYNMFVGNIPLNNLSNYKTKEAKILIPQTAEAMKKLLDNFKKSIVSGS